MGLAYRNKTASPDHFRSEAGDSSSDSYANRRRTPVRRLKFAHFAAARQRLNGDDAKLATRLHCAPPPEQAGIGGAHQLTMPPDQSSRAAQVWGPDTREIGTTLVEQLIATNAYEAQQMLDEVDSRFASPHSAPASTAAAKVRTWVSSDNKATRDKTPLPLRRVPVFGCARLVPRQALSSRAVCVSRGQPALRS